MPVKFDVVAEVAAEGVTTIGAVREVGTFFPPKTMESM